MTATGTDVVVIGGGIVGASAAAFLAEAGATVTLVERDGLASGASGANSGVVQHPFDPILAALYRETSACIGSWRTADLSGSGSAPSRPACSTCPRTRPPSAASSRSLAEAFPELGAGRGRRHRTPGDRAGDRARRVGLPVGIGYPVAPAASTYAYATIAERRGVRVRAGRRRLDRRGEGVVGVVVDGVSTPADAVLVAAGPGSPASSTRPGRGSRSARAGASSSRPSSPTGPPTSSRRPRSARRSAPARRGRPTPNPASDFSLVPLDGVAAVGSTFLRRGAGTGGLGRADPTRASDVRPGRRRRADPGHARVRPAAEPRRPAADRSHPGDARPVHLRRPRRVGDLDRAGLGPDGRRRDPRPVSGHPGRARSGQVRERQPGSTTMTSSRRGPWTPSTRWSSMSLVADGPLIHVCGRSGRAGRAPPGRSRRPAPRGRRRRGGRAAGSARDDPDLDRRRARSCRSRRSRRHSR